MSHEPEATPVAPPRPDGGHDDILTSHNYDGIQEYDNPIPGWWKWLFIATIAFAPLYLVYFHAPGMARDHFGRYDAALAANLRLQFGDLPDLEPDAATILTYMNDPKCVKVGASTFETNCKSCHNPGGAGGTGPNLTDDHYLNVKTVADIGTVIQDGANNGAMPAWKNRLHPKELVLVASYVASLRGQHLPGKAPEGEVIPPWSAEPVE